jgi:hypothetical protein
MAISDVVLGWISSHRSLCEVDEAYQISIFKGFRGHDSIRIEVHDRGPAVSNRYSVTVTNVDTEAESASKPASSVEEALASINWSAVG